MCLTLAAIRAGIFDRAFEISEDVLAQATDQIATGEAQIRAFRIWRSKRCGR